MSNQYKTILVLVFGIFVGVSVSLTSSVMADKKSEESVEMLYNLFEALNSVDSSRVIIEHYTTIYESAKNEKDRIIKTDPSLADSLLLYWNKKLRADTTTNPFNRRTW